MTQHTLSRLAVLLTALIAVPAAAADPEMQHLRYSAYSLGLHVMNLSATADVGATAYRIGVSYQLTGVVGAIVHGQSETVVDGLFAGARAEPRQLWSHGQLRGVPRYIQIDWQDGQPIVSRLEPPNEAERDPVPPAEQANTIDSLSALAALIRQVAQTGRCDSQATTFDGRRLSTIAARTVGMETLPPSERSIFAGPALRCDFEGRQIGGFLKNEDLAQQRRVQHGSAWFARLTPEAPPMPVRITFETRLFGPATMYLTAG